MQMNSPDFLWQRLSNARIMRAICQSLIETQLVSAGLYMY